jgi:hypothetical protein
VVAVKVLVREGFGGGREGFAGGRGRGITWKRKDEGGGSTTNLAAADGDEGVEKQIQEQEDDNSKWEGKESKKSNPTQWGKMMVNRLLIPLMTLALGRMFLVRTVGCSITQLESVGGMLVKFVGSTIMLPMTVEDACHGTWVLSFVQLKWKIKASFSLMSVLIQEL